MQNTPIMKRQLEEALRNLGVEFDERCMEKLKAENDKVSKLSEIVDLIQFQTTNVTEVVAEPKEVQRD